MVVDWWEKLAGASLALASVVQLSTISGFDLVQPRVRSSMFVPSGPGTLPLSTYYDTLVLRSALSPQRLVSLNRLRTIDRAKAALVVLVYDDFPRDCRDALGQDAASYRCPSACTERIGRLVTPVVANITAGWRHACLAAREVASALRSSRPPALFRRFHALALLNFRRHDAGRSMLPVAQAARLRARAVVPARALRTAARRFATGHLAYAVVQLRSNHLAHSAYVRGGEESCVQLLTACVRRLSRATRRLAPPAATVVASDLQTLFWRHQDGESHHRHDYVRRCLRPSLPALRRWHAAAGAAFNCSAIGSADGDGTDGAATPGSGLGRGRCDAGALGLVDLVLASEAASFVAVDVRRPWPSAFLEWIVHLRAARGRNSTLIRCD